MIAAGICLLVIGALWEVAVFWSGAWPWALTWLLMGLGLAMTAIGCTRARACDAGGVDRAGAVRAHGHSLVGVRLAHPLREPNMGAGLVR